MEKIRLIIGMVLLICVSGIGMAQKEDSETLTVPLSNPGKTYTLKVKLLSGDINVTGYDGNEIVINATPGAEEDEEVNDRSETKGMKKISAGGGFEITAKEADNIITVNNGSLGRNIRLDIRVPQNGKLRLGTVNEGVVSVKNIKGEIEVDNVNDDIELENISGSAVANTISGEVIVSFSTVDPGASMAFSTLSGDINVTFPESVKANFKLKSDMGDVFSDFDIDIDKNQAKTEKTTEPGLYKIKKDNWVSGKVNGGGPEIMFKSMSGDIYIRKAKK
ncbi:MAG TPA: DUF4097 family beta strand repeat-containing protein [Bacteroidales bacterium]|nr:DUF4097 family beta strand repeat-containing protein [Bacteroidales bacterium]